MIKLTLDLEVLQVESFDPAGESRTQEYEYQQARIGGSGATPCFTGSTCASGGPVCCA